MKPSNRSTDDTQKSEPNIVRSQLQAHNDYVIGLIDTIHPKWYFDRDTVQKVTEDFYAKLDEKGNCSQKKKVARLDISMFKPVSQILGDRDVAEKALRKKIKKKKSEVTLYSAALDRASSLDELKERLREKIEAMKAKRKVPTSSREDRKIMKLERLKASRKKKRNKASKGTVDAMTADGSNVQEGSPENKVPPKTVPVFNKEGKMVFSKFDLAETDIPTHEKRAGLKKVSNQPKRLLKKLDAEAEKMKRLEEKDPEHAKEVKQKKQWLKAIDKAEGIKVKDNPGLLKKTMKRKEQQKKHSRKKWNERTEAVEKRQKDRQEKRKKNIQERKKSKLQAKMKKLKKRGRVIPGF